MTALPAGCGVKETVPAICSDAFPAGFAGGDDIEFMEVSDDATALAAGCGVKETVPAICSDAFPAGFAGGAGIGATEGGGEGAAALPDDVTALAAGNDVDEAGPASLDAERPAIWLPDDVTALPAGIDVDEAGPASLDAERPAICGNAFPAGFAGGAGIEPAGGGEGVAALLDDVAALPAGNGVEEARPASVDAGRPVICGDAFPAGFAGGAGIEPTGGGGEGAAALPDGVTALPAGNGVKEPELALADVRATDSDFRVAPCSLGSLAARVRDDGAAVVETLEDGSPRGTRKPTAAIDATAVKAAIPAKSSPVENGLGPEVEFMMPRVKI